MRSWRRRKRSRSDGASTRYNRIVRLEQKSEAAKGAWELGAKSVLAALDAACEDALWALDGDGTTTVPAD